MRVPNAFLPLPALPPAPPLLCAVANGTTITVVCTRADGQAWADFSIVLETKTETTGVTGCSDEDTNTVQVTALVQPAVNVVIDSNPGVCSDATTSVTTWSITSDLASSLEVTLNAGGATCTMQDAAGAAIASPGEQFTQGSAASAVLVRAWCLQGLPGGVVACSAGPITQGARGTCSQPSAGSATSQGCNR